MHPSVIEVTNNGTRSALTACRSITPLKVLNPATHGEYCAVILSSYGGGIVEGDDVTLRVRCGKQQSLYLGTQALTKVYKNPQGTPSKQTIIGTVETNGLAVVLPDPVVPYKKSIFEQDQQWHLAPNACLVITDGHTSGRFAYNEHFAYNKYTSNLTIHTPDHPILIERYNSEPAIVPPTNVGAFASYNVVYNVFIAGTPGESRFTTLTESLPQHLKPFLKPADDASILLSFASPKPELFIVRALAHDVENLNPLYTALSKAVSMPNILGNDPLSRKY